MIQDPGKNSTILITNNYIMKKKVYIGMSADVFHHGHVNIISEARKHGDVIVGLLNDRAVAGHKRTEHPPESTWGEHGSLEALDGLQ